MRQPLAIRRLLALETAARFRTGSGRAGAPLSAPRASGMPGKGAGRGAHSTRTPGHRRALPSDQAGHLKELLPAGAVRALGCRRLTKTYIVSMWRRAARGRRGQRRARARLGRAAGARTPPQAWAPLARARARGCRCAFSGTFRQSPASRRHSPPGSVRRAGRAQRAPRTAQAQTHLDCCHPAPRS